MNTTPKKTNDYEWSAGGVSSIVFGDSITSGIIAVGIYQTKKWLRSVINDILVSFELVQRLLC
jgi:hypothetical protein